MQGTPKPKSNETAGDLRAFGLIAAVMLSSLGFWRGWWKSSPYLLSLPLILAFLALRRPKALRPVYRGMLVVTHPLGWVMSHAVLTVMFVCVVIPTGILMRICGKSPMRKGMDRKAETYWVRRPETAAKEQCERQF